jgi:hypothetical protein
MESNASEEKVVFDVGSLYAQLQDLPHARRFCDAHPN